MSKLLLIAGTHGDEEFAVNVLKSLEKSYPKDEYSYEWLVGNPEALKKKKRYIDADLNRSAPGDPDSNLYELRRASELITICNQCDIVIDLHGTRTDCGLVSIVPYPTTQNLQLVASIGLEKNVVWYSKQSDISGPLVQHTTAAAIEIECGPKDSIDTSNELHKQLSLILELNKSNSLLTKNYDASLPIYNVYDVKRGKIDPSLTDFVLTKNEDETYYPFLSNNQYDGITCYKMELITDAIEKIVIK